MVSDTVFTEISESHRRQWIKTVSDTIIFPLFSVAVYTVDWQNEASDNRSACKR